MTGPKIKRDKKTLEWALAVEVRFRKKAEAERDSWKTAYEKAVEEIGVAQRDHMRSINAAAQSRQEWQQRAEKAEAALSDSTNLLRDIRLCDDDEGRVAAQISDNNDILAGKSATTDADRYREALQKILAATNDPWGNSQHTIAGLCNEALDRKP